MASLRFPRSAQAVGRQCPPCTQLLQGSETALFYSCLTVLLCRTSTLLLNRVNYFQCISCPSLPGKPLPQKNLVLMLLCHQCSYRMKLKEHNFKSLFSTSSGGVFKYIHYNLKHRYVFMKQIAHGRQYLLSYYFFCPE